MTTRRVVVVGSGASGFALAVRLGQAGHAVTLVERGAREGGTPRRGAAWDLSAAMPGAGTALGYRTDLRPGGGYAIARGSTLGGSSAVNGGYFLRAHPADFDVWARLCGPEWSYASCLPALVALERDADFPDDAVHGASGPVPVRRPGAGRITERFVAAAAAGGAVLEADKNGGGPSGVGLLACNVEDGVRWGADQAYGPLAEGTVRLLADTWAERVAFVGDAVRGLRVVRGGRRRLLEADEVILSCGAIETPRLLRRSGVGARGEVTAPPVAELGAVGRGLADHPAVALRWTPRPGIVDPAAEVAWTAAWNAAAGDLAAHPVELLAAVLPTEAIVTGVPHDAGSVDLRVSAGGGGSPGRGEVRGPESEVEIRYDYLATAEERESLRAGVRAGIALLRGAECAPVVDEVEIVATLGADPGDDELDAWIARELATSLHSVGTARMGDGPLDAVVDAHGRVFGVTGLRVADCSILPTAPSRGTSNTAFLIGERIARLIADEDADRT